MSDYYRDISLILSRVMDDIGLNEECVMRRRRTYLLDENVSTLTSSLIVGQCKNHIFGSQTEGTTTRGLNSDLDLLFLVDYMTVIQDWKDWSPGIRNYMMIQDETTYPGYCKLQTLRLDMPLLVDRLPNADHVYDEKRRIILKNDVFVDFIPNLLVQNGPALTYTDIDDGEESDHVFAIRCETWPKHYKQWSSRREARHWPTPEMVEYMESSGCFVVPVGHRLAERRDREWRISTSMAERCLMFNLNITQIRCYVILKMVAKTFIQPFVPDVISSYICKTLLFHTIERTSRDFWREQNLLVCVIRVLLSMYAAVYGMNCPNYFNESANLLLGKIDQGSRLKMLCILRVLLRSQGRFLLQIGYDNISDRLTTYILDRHLMSRYEENEYEKVRCCMECTIKIHGFVSVSIRLIRFGIDEDSGKMRELLKFTLKYAKKGRPHYKAASLLFPYLCSHIATVDTSERIRRGQTVSPTSVLLYKFSLDSDAASSRLKFASFLYCSGQHERTLSVLQHVEQRMESGAVPFCHCVDNYTTIHEQKWFEMAVKERILKAYPSTCYVGLCVMFSRVESQCCPPELLFELFRSTVEERLNRKKLGDIWMDLAVMDCLPFLYYLQYMAAKNLGQRDLQWRALNKLIQCAFGDEPLGHRETVYNVLGQCMEHENLFEKAVLCYRMSLQQIPRNNAVKWLISKLLYNTIQRR